MSFKSLCSLLILSLFSIACKTEYVGQIEVLETLKPVVKKGDKTIEPGTYKAELKFKRNDKAELEITKSGRRNNPVLALNLKGAQIPRENGPFVVSSVISGQPFNMRGELTTNRTETPLQRGRESCQEQVPERFCWRDNFGRVYCETRWRTVYGSQDIEYFDRFTDSRIDADIESVQNPKMVARLSATDSSAERVVTYRSRCYWY